MMGFSFPASTAIVGSVKLCSGLTLLERRLVYDYIKYVLEVCTRRNTVTNRNS